MRSYCCSFFAYFFYKLKIVCKVFIGLSTNRINHIKNCINESAKIITIAGFLFTAALSFATLLLLAAVQKNAVTNVRRGENSGKKLTYVQIVRHLENIPLNGKNNGVATIELPQKINTSELEIIALLQNTANGKILAATKANF